MLSFFPRGVLDEILNLIESVSEGFPSYSNYFECPKDKPMEGLRLGHLKRFDSIARFVFRAFKRDSISMLQITYKINKEITK